MKIKLSPHNKELQRKGQHTMIEDDDDIKVISSASMTNFDLFIQGFTMMQFRRRSVGPAEPSQCTQRNTRHGWGVTPSLILIVGNTCIKKRNKRTPGLFVHVITWNATHNCAKVKLLLLSFWPITVPVKVNYLFMCPFPVKIHGPLLHKTPTTATIVMGKTIISNNYIIRHYLIKFVPSALVGSPETLEIRISSFFSSCLSVHGNTF